MDIFADHIPIPEIFWSFETGKPISHCALCDCDLMTPGTNYIIEKAFKDSETIFEHALCLDCTIELRKEISTESIAQIKHYFETNADMPKRQEQCLSSDATDFKKWIGHCLIKGYPQEECGEFQLYGFCIDQDLMINGYPYILSGEALDEIIDLLSEKTLGALNHITERIFGIDAPKNIVFF